LISCDAEQYRLEHVLAKLGGHLLPIGTARGPLNPPSPKPWGYDLGKHKVRPEHSHTSDNRTARETISEVGHQEEPEIEDTNVVLDRLADEIQARDPSLSRAKAINKASLDPRFSRSLRVDRARKFGS
jgi:hypothetical protein